MASFTDGAGNWDNNSAANWNFTIRPAPVPTPLPRSDSNEEEIAP